jgi:hypothetical protein
MKVIFLDIDGVLNSFRTCIATGNYPHGLDKGLKHFDWIAIRLLQRLSDSTGVVFVLSSSWRILHDYKDVGKALDLPIIDATKRLDGPRGAEIAEWLSRHPEVELYAILDDDSDMLDGQLACFVQTSAYEGLSWANYCRLCSILGASEFEGEARGRDDVLNPITW